MELKDIIQFIKGASHEDKSAIKAALKNPPEKPKINDLCQEDIKRLIDLFPHTTDAHKGYRYNNTSAYYVQMIKELTSAITHNYICKHNTRGYPVWTAADVVISHPDEYREAFHALTDMIITLTAQSNTSYPHAK